jgi:hypothetical protein
MSAGIWLYERDYSGLISGARIYVLPCANEPNPEARDERGIHAWQHGLAEVVYDDGATVLCRPCAKARGDEEARQARLRALPPFAREFLIRNGREDWKL